jgi:hypothetical protein
MFRQLIFTSILIFTTTFANANQWQLECPDLSNSQRCAMRYEAEVIKNYPQLISKADGKLRIRLQNGRNQEIADISQLQNVVAVIKQAQIAVIREQFGEGNTWHLLSLIDGTMTEIAGYPVPSPNTSHVFVIEPWDESGYTKPKAAIYKINKGKPKLVWLAKCDLRNWGPTKPNWKSNAKLSFTQTKAFEFGEIKEAGIVMVAKLNQKWISTGLRCNTKSPQN